MVENIKDSLDIEREFVKLIFSSPVANSAYHQATTEMRFGHFTNLGSGGTGGYSAYSNLIEQFRDHINRGCDLTKSPKV